MQDPTAPPRHSPKGALANEPTRVPANVPARVPAGVKRNFSNSTFRVRNARGYDSTLTQRLTCFRTRPRPAGVSGILKFLALRVRGRTRVRFRPHPATCLRPVPYALRLSAPQT